MKHRLAFGQLAPVLSADLRDAAHKAGVTDDATVKRLQTINPAESMLEPGSRTAVNVITSREMDRDGEIIDPEGWILDDFLKSPCVFLNHNTAELPIGTDVELGISADRSRLIAKTKYGSTQTARDVFTLKQEGIMRMSSVGFVRLEAVQRGGPGWSEVIKRLGKRWDMDVEGTGCATVTTKAYMLEHSDVGLAANMDAETLAVAKRLMSGGTAKLMGMAEIVAPDECTADDIVRRIAPVVKRLQRVRILPKPVDIASVMRDLIEAHRGRV